MDEYKINKNVYQNINLEKNQINYISNKKLDNNRNSSYGHQFERNKITHQRKITGIYTISMDIIRLIFFVLNILNKNRNNDKHQKRFNYKRNNKKNKKHQENFKSNTITNNYNNSYNSDNNSDKNDINYFISFVGNIKTYSLYIKNNKG